tara:strand:+ start:2790 stop:3701 length:912 start_codon:yes stop_codon:yes gene_type:complete
MITGLNVLNCSSSDVVGTGLAGCRIDRKRVVAIGLLAKGTILSGLVDKAYIQNLQQLGKLIYLKGVITFADNTPDPTIITREGSGFKTLVSELPYEYLATFDNGQNFQKALKSLSGNGNYDLVLWDVDDVMWLTKSLAGDAKGFALGMHNSGKYVGNDGTNAASQTLMLQLTERSEVDERMSFVTATDYSSNDIDGVNDVNIAISPIAALSTSIVFAPYLLDGSHLVEGLTIPNLRVTRNGIIVVPTAISYTATEGKVTLTVSSNTAASVVTVQLFDSSLVKPVILSAADVLYKSNVATAVVV